MTDPNPVPGPPTDPISGPVEFVLHDDGKVLYRFQAESYFLFDDLAVDFGETPGGADRPPE